MDRMKVVKVARRYIGVHEGSDIHHDIIDLYNTVKPDGYKAKYSDHWCAEFVSACFISAYGKELAQRVFPLSASCIRMIAKAKKMHVWVESDRYHALPGDVVLYDWQDSGKGDNKGTPDHVGIVSATSKDGVVVIEGNYSDKVKYRELKYNGRYIRGFITPHYNDGDRRIIDKMADDVLKGKYGNGKERKEKLGAYYDAVQAEVNRRLKKK